MNLNFLKILLTSTFFPILALTSCLNDESNESQSAVEEGNKDKNKITELKKELEFVGKMRDSSNYDPWMAMRWYGMYKLIYGISMLRELLTREMRLKILTMESLVQKLLSFMVKEMAHSDIGMRMVTLSPKVNGSTEKRMVCSVSGIKRASYSRWSGTKAENLLKSSRIDYGHQAGRIKIPEI